MWTQGKISPKYGLSNQGASVFMTCSQFGEDAVQHQWLAEILRGNILCNREASSSDLREIGFQESASLRCWLGWQAHKHKKKIPINTS